MRKTFSTFTEALNPNQEDAADLRRGPWTLEEDNILKNYISRHGEGRWNLLAKCSGLKRTGKSCRLRWLNYLKPDIKRGNLTPQEQLLILQLHSKWGNRWSKIAQHLPGRTDNEIKNYWRTRVQKQARLLKVESNSTNFTVAVRNILKQKLLNHNHMDQNPSYNNFLATFSSPLLSSTASNSQMNFLPQNTTPNFSNIISPESSSNPLAQGTEGSSPYNLSVMTSSDYPVIPVPGHVPPIDPLKTPAPGRPRPSAPSNSADSEKSAIAVRENYNHNHDHVGLEDKYCVDMEELPTHGTYETGNYYDMSPSTTRCQLEESDEWDYINLPGGYWSMDDIWQFRGLEEFGI